jgi:hypothetical protein
MAKLTDKEKNKLVFSGLTALVKVATLYGVHIDTISNKFRGIMIDCYAEGYKDATKFAQDYMGKFIEGKKK